MGTGSYITTGSDDIRWLTYDRESLSPYRTGVPSMYICICSHATGAGANRMRGAKPAAYI